jgi:universal stress protein A
LDISDKENILIKRILVPTDFSPASLKAVDYAIDLAKPHKALLLFIFVIEPMNYAVPRFYPRPTELLEEQRKMATEHLSRVIEQVRKRYKNCRGEVHFGVVYQVISEVAQSSKSDIIVMSTHGHTGLQHLLMGSVAERVVRGATIPVLTVRAAGKAGSKGKAARRPRRRSNFPPSEQFLIAPVLD